MTFVQARNFTKGPRRGPIELLVIHTMESPEKPDTAEAVADWFAGKTAPQASPHYCIDNNSIVQCVKDTDIAWAAPGANHNGLQLEHAGRALQGTAGWNDAYSRAVLARSADLAYDLCVKYDITVQHLTVAGLLAGQRGLIGHIDATMAFPGPGRTHTDPGPSFPWIQYLALIRSSKPAWYLNALTLDPMWAWFAWKDHGAPPALRPTQIPARVPAWWWARYALHRGNV